MPRKVCAWVSRHDPTPEQAQALAGYEIVRVPSIRGGFKHHKQVWSAIVCQCGLRPDLVVAVLPAVLMVHLALHAEPTPVVRAPGEYDEFTDGFKWSGKWRRVVGFSVQTEGWTP